MDKKSLIIQILTNKTLHLTLFLLYFIIVVFLSLHQFSQNQPQIQLPYIDKIIHYCFYFGMSILALSSVNFNNKRYKGITFFVVLLIVLLIGALIELIQPYFNRTSDADDMIINSLGAISGSIVYLLFHNKIKHIILSKYKSK